jgi:gas vesicle protein
MRKIAMIAFAVALGLSWSGVAIPADVKEETKEKARDAKETMKDAGETTKEKLKDVGEATKEESKEVGEKIKEAGHSVKVRTAQQALVGKGFNPGRWMA